MRTDYEERQQLKQARFERLAALYEKESINAHAHARQMADVIPFGQPILIGHHSEKRDRNYRARIMRRYKKSYELDKKAKYYRERLETMRCNDAISSDNPDAINLLREKLVKLQKNQESYKDINKIIRSKQGEQEKKDALQKLFPTWEKEIIDRLFVPDWCGRVGIADYVLTNNNGNMARIKKRIEILEKLNAVKTQEKMYGDIRLVQNAEENRIQIFFPGKPDENTRKELKSHGFHWSPMNKCWQRMISNNAIYYAKQILSKLTTPTPQEAPQCAKNY